MFFEGSRHFYIKSFCLVTTVCTVDLEIPNFFAVVLTVALFSIMYSASITVLSSMRSFKYRLLNTALIRAYALRSKKSTAI